MDTPSESSASRASVLAADLRALVGKMKRKLREQADTGDLPPSQVSVLLRLERDGAASTSALARAEGMRPQSMAVIVAALEAAGMVQGAPDPSDGRRVLLSLTDTCRTWIEQGRAARQDWLSRALHTRLSEAEMALLAEATVLLRRISDE